MTSGNLRHTWLRFGAYSIPSEVESDEENARYYHDDIPRMTLVELLVERRCVEEAWAGGGRRLDPDDVRRCWLQERWRKLTDAIVREEAAV